MHEELGGIETPEPIEVARFPSVVMSVVPVCVVSKCVYTSVAKCVLQRTHSVGARACTRATACMDEAPCVNETPCVEATPCVSGVVVSVPGCVLPSTLCEEEAPRVKEAVCVSETVCMKETPRVSVPTCVSSMACVKKKVHVSEARCVSGTAWVRSLCVREMTVGMREHATACPNVMEWCLSVVTRRCA